MADITERLLLPGITYSWGKAVKLLEDTKQLGDRLLYKGYSRIPLRVAEMVVPSDLTKIIEVPKLLRWLDTARRRTRRGSVRSALSDLIRRWKEYQDLMKDPSSEEVQCSISLKVGVPRRNFDEFLNSVRALILGQFAAFPMFPLDHGVWILDPSQPQFLSPGGDKKNLKRLIKSVNGQLATAKQFARFAERHLNNPRGD